MYNTTLEINLLCDLGYKGIEFCLNIQRKKMDSLFWSGLLRLYINIGESTLV